MDSQPGIGHRFFYRIARPLSSTSYMTLDEQLQPGNRIYNAVYEPLAVLNKHAPNARGLEVIVMNCSSVPLSDAKIKFSKGRFVVIEESEGRIVGGRVETTKNVQYFDETTFDKIRVRILSSLVRKAYGRAAPKFIVYGVLSEDAALMEEISGDGKKVEFNYLRSDGGGIKTLQGIQTQQIYDKRIGVIPRQLPQKQFSGRASPIYERGKRERQGKPNTIVTDQLPLFPEPSKRKVVPIREGINIGQDDDLPF